jgi:SHS2 domain-containing protein
MQAGYEFFDHTADLGLRVWAPSRAELLLPAADALYAAIGELVAGPERTPVRLDLHGPDSGVLLRDYLAQLLEWFETRNLLLSALEEPTFEERRLCAAAILSPVDAKRSRPAREVKAVTYHELSVRKLADGYEGTVIVDI